MRYVGVIGWVIDPATNAPQKPATGQTGMATTDKGSVRGLAAQFKYFRKEDQLGDLTLVRLPRVELGTLRSVV